MIGVNITTKDGILLFSHFFVSGFSDVDEDLRAGLMAAVLNAVQETHQGTGINTINQGNYFVHIVNGQYTYGIFFSHENDLKIHNFANSTLKRFEYTFGEKLGSKITFKDHEFSEFKDHLSDQYNALIAIDVAKLSKIIQIMQGSFFSDYILLEKPNLHQVFTHISSLKGIQNFSNQIGTMCKNLIESSIIIGHETEKIEFNLGKSYQVFVNSFLNYVVILIVRNKDRNKAIKEILNLRNAIK